MGYRRFFKTFFRLSIALSLIWLFILISPDNCSCPSRFWHNVIWASGGLSIYIFFLLIFNGTGKSIPDKIFNKLCKLPKTKYKYEILEVKTKGDLTFYIPTVKTMRFYPPFYICVNEDEKTKYSLVDPAGNQQYFCKSREDALYAISLVKNDINDKSVKYDYDLWFCHICPLRKDCCTKHKNPSKLTVKISQY